MTGGDLDYDLSIVARGSPVLDLRRVCIISLESVLYSILSHRLSPTDELRKFLLLSQAIRKQWAMNIRNIPTR